MTQISFYSLLQNFHPSGKVQLGWNYLEKIFLLSFFKARNLNYILTNICCFDISIVTISLGTHITCWLSSGEGRRKLHRSQKDHGL